MKKSNNSRTAVKALKNTYFDLIDQTFVFPQDNFRTEDMELFFHNIPLMEIIAKHGTPLKLTYLPKISEQIIKAKEWFKQAIENLDYQGTYNYCYCTKSNHFKYILEEVLKNDVNLETSSAFDIDLIQKLYTSKQIDKNTIVINNGFKTEEYAAKICDAIKQGFRFIPICDNKEELNYYLQNLEQNFDIGVRVATDEEPKFEFYTSRLGIRKDEVMNFYLNNIAVNPHVNLKMLHFFMDTGIKDSIYYWSELKKCIRIYCELKRISPSLDSINFGGGLPIQTSLNFEYDYPYMIEEIIRLIQEACKEFNLDVPDIYTEFGKYTVGESGATIFSVLGQKQQNDAELWYIIDNSLMTALPDVWGMKQSFVLLPINKWNHAYHRVNIGGLTCDNEDYYNSEGHTGQLYLPKFSSDDQTPLYIGFFHTAAYQDSISGYGGTKHCLIPAPKHILIDKNENGQLIDKVIAPEQTAQNILNILGY